MKSTHKGSFVALGTAALLSPMVASAITVTEVVTEITATLVPIGLIGSAVLLVFVAVKAFKWVARAM